MIGTKVHGVNRTIGQVFRFISMQGVFALLGATALHAAVIYDYKDTTFNDHIVFSLPSFATDGSLNAASLTTATSTHGTISGFAFHLVSGPSTCSLGLLNSPCIDIFFGASEIQSVRIALTSMSPTVSVYTGVTATDAVLTVTNQVPEPATLALLPFGIGLFCWLKRNTKKQSTFHSPA